MDGALASSAQNLCGSWTDSGINALSVVRRLVPKIKVEGMRRTMVPGFPHEVQASMDFSFASEGGRTGLGQIDTNWTLGWNRKNTCLSFGHTDSQIVLDHSEQRAFLLDDGRTRVLADFSGEKARLVAHYLGVFVDFFESMGHGTDNRTLTRELLTALRTQDF